MAFDLIVVFAGQLFLQELQSRLLEFLDFPATQAAEMIMVGVAVNMLVMPVAVAEIHFPDQAAIDEERQSPVDGGLGDLGALALELQIEPVYIKVAVNLEDFPENFLALRRAPQSPLAKIILEDLEFGGHNLQCDVIEN